MTATSHAGVGAVFAARLSPPPPGAASAVHGDLFFLLGSFLKTKLYCWRPQKGGSPSFTLTNAWPKITSLREPCCWRPYTGARRAHGEDARAAAGFKAPLPRDAAALLPAACLFLCVCWLRGRARCSTCPGSREKFGPGALQAHLEHRCEPKPPALTSLLLQESAGTENFILCCS